MAAHHRVPVTLRTSSTKGQIVQGEALNARLEHWRRRKYGTAGVLFWQLNDCWPVTSWSVIDSALRPKAAYYSQSGSSPLFSSASGGPPAAPRSGSRATCRSPPQGRSMFRLSRSGGGGAEALGTDPAERRCVGTVHDRACAGPPRCRPGDVTTCWPGSPRRTVPRSRTGITSPSPSTLLSLIPASRCLSSPDRGCRTR